MVEKERKKDLGKVVTGGGEGTGKTNHREHGGHGERQTTEDTEDTEMGREGADTQVRPYTARRLEVERAVLRAGWRLELPYSSRLCRSAGVTAGMASLAACSTLRRRLEVERAGVRGGWR